MHSSPKWYCFSLAISFFFFFWILRQVLGCLLCWIISLSVCFWERERSIAFILAHVPQTPQVASSIPSKTYPPQNHNIFAHSGKDMMVVHYPCPTCSRDSLSTCQGSKVNAWRLLPEVVSITTWVELLLSWFDMVVTCVESLSQQPGLVTNL